MIKMVEIEECTYNGEDFSVLKEYEGWKIGFLRYGQRFSAFTEMERHLLTEEAFVLLNGSAILYTENESRAMEYCKLYNIPRGVWHHIVVSEDALVLVVENSNTTKDNTEKKKCTA